MGKKLDTALSNIDKKLGKGIIQKGTELDGKVPLLASTGSLSLDLVMGCGGIPQNRIIEVYGPPSGGKTTITLHMMREVQKVGGVVAFVDMENSFDPEWAENIGINVEEIYFSQPVTGADAFEVIDELVVSDEVDLIVVDSVSSMATEAELEGGYSDAHMAQLARLMSQGLKKINTVMRQRKNKCTIAFINQTRSNIGGYGNPEVTSGGNALKFYASVRLDVRRGEFIGGKEDPIGFVTKVKTVKNKVGPPYRKVEVSLYIGGEDGTRWGIDNDMEIVDLAIQNGIINRAGAWYNFEIDGEEQRLQGKERVANFLKEDTAKLEKIKTMVLDKVLKKIEKPAEGSFDYTVEKEVDKKEGRKPRTKKEDDEVESPIATTETKGD